ncbi:DUF927 domain-containing protein [Salmonella enterica subsp. enterica serovar Infantis]|uniref:DUF927 domain-containing protein n=2 Tax=Enterobacteriaceae TaxID=543 RepID=A0A3V5LK18_SALIN|nr:MULTISPECIES: DUF927 domain-containing protein [Enterobacteriaceae]EAA8182067.1 DUF927 domain-containing protein [Salmonella enterica subsp. enterica serovar Infantis]EAU1795303.1 DUF927 domain-containing protein [Salmonella enterica]EBS2638921.1 DUF927 domain-containing protein [Salmonella enterica subsp. enterica serovar Agona]ECE6898397.1 DUF927 domain-containing protein [Salmonella enterica subsp. enterica]EDH7680944.1 hypothetical protein [Salmonella enterica subsp. enterica serovar En
MNMKVVKSELSYDDIQATQTILTEKFLIETAFFANSEYLIHETGIYKLKSSMPKKGTKKEFFWDKISNYYIYPVQMLNTVDLDLEEESDETSDASKDINSFYIKVEFYNIRKEKKHLNIPHDLFADLSRSKLRKHGYTLPPDLNTLRDVQRAVNAALEAGQNKYMRVDGKMMEPFIDCIPAYIRRGWVNDFTHIRESHPQFVGSMPTRTRRVGNASIQINVFKEIMASSRLACIFFCIAFASYTRGRIRKTANFSPIFNIYGKRATGKTTLALFVASIEGAPSKENGLIRDSKTTYVGLENFLANYTNGWFVVDELDDIFRKNAGDAVSQLMTIANNGGRSKFDQDTEATEGKSWNMVIVSTSNKPLSELVQGDMKEGAIESRIEEFDVQDPELNIFPEYIDDQGEDVVGRWQEEINDNYGHFYPMIIDYIVENADTLNKKIKIYEGELTGDPNYQRLKDDRRTIQTIALLKIGADMIKDIIGDEYGELCHEAIDIHKSRFSNVDEPDFDVNEDNWTRIDILKDWINANKGSFVWETYAYTNDDSDLKFKSQKAEAKRYSDIAQTKGNVLGVIHLDSPMESNTDFNGNIILNTIGEESLKRTFKLDIAELKTAAQALGLLEDGKKLGVAKKKKLSAGDKIPVSTRGTFIHLKNRPVIQFDKESKDDLLNNEVLDNFNKDNKSDLEDILKYASSNLDNVVDGEPIELDDPDFVPF